VFLQYIRTYSACVVCFKNIHGDSVTTLNSQTCSLAYAIKVRQHNTLLTYLKYVAITKKLCFKIQHILQRNVYILAI